MPYGANTLSTAIKYAYPQNERRLIHFIPCNNRKFSAVILLKITVFLCKIIIVFLERL